MRRKASWGRCRSLEASFELIVPLVVAAMIDRGIGQGNKGYAGRMTLLLIALGLVGLVCSVSGPVLRRQGFGGLRHPAAACADGAFAEVYLCCNLDKVGSSTLTTRMTSDMNQVQNGHEPGPAAVAALALCGVRGHDHGVHRGCKGGHGLRGGHSRCCLVVVFGIMLLTIPLYKKVQAQSGRSDSACTRENLTGVRVLRAFWQGGGRKARNSGDRNRDLTTDAEVCGPDFCPDESPDLRHHQSGAIIGADLSPAAQQVDAGALTQGQRGGPV